MIRESLERNGRLTGAEACDMECAQALKAAPGAPRPGACPAEENPDLPYEFIKSILISEQEILGGDVTEYKFG